MSTATTGMPTTSSCSGETATSSALPAEYRGRRLFKAAAAEKSGYRGSDGHHFAFADGRRLRRGQKHRPINPGAVFIYVKMQNIAVIASQPAGWRGNLPVRSFILDASWVSCTRGFPRSLRSLGMTVKNGSTRRWYCRYIFTLPQSRLSCRPCEWSSRPRRKLSQRLHGTRSPDRPCPSSDGWIPPGWGAAFPQLLHRQQA